MLICERAAAGDDAQFGAERLSVRDRTALNAVSVASGVEWNPDVSPW